MALSGMDIQNQFPLITEHGLKNCLTDSSYLDFITSRAVKVLEHNRECKECAFKTWCLGGCRASGLDFSGERDLYYRDEASCTMFCGGYIEKLIRLMEKNRPGITCSAADDENLRKTFASQKA